MNLPKIFFEAVLDVLYSKKSEIQPNENDFDEEYSTPLQNALTMSNPELKDSEFKCSIKALRKVVKKFKKSALLTNFLEKETGKKLHLDVKTRWSSLCTMIESYIKIKDHVKMALIKANEKITLTPTMDNNLQTILNILRPIESAINELSKKDANIITADIVLTKMLNNIESCLDSQLKTDFIISNKNTFQGLEWKTAL